MKINDICRHLAIRVLGEPGTKIQCMNNIDSIHRVLKIGKIYTVREAMNSTCLDLEDMPHQAAFYLASMFKKVQ